ncbi:hypothetical protein KCP74_09610 [Salmonella enterica subsp. enterica]|nr:hypothetical protein KCP74_09610 [Salmonella enterica subsp. enterica]
MTLIKSATAKHSVKNAGFAGILPTFTRSDERYSAGCRSNRGFLARCGKYSELY